MSIIKFVLASGQTSKNEHVLSAPTVEDYGTGRGGEEWGGGGAGGWGE